MPRIIIIPTNAQQDFGFVVAAFVPLVCLWIFGEDHLEPVWRLSLGLGVVPAVAVFLWRLSKANKLLIGYWLLTGDICRDGKSTVIQATFDETCISPVSAHL
jgi:hypothetical protein